MRLMRQRGDTIIEVMVAFSVFAMVAVGALTVMNQGTAGAQNTLETTLVRQQVDNQAEMLRFLHQAYLADASSTVATTPSGKFKAIIDRATTVPTLTQPTPFGDACTQNIPGSTAKRFALDEQGAMRVDGNIQPINSVTTQAPYAQMDGSTAYGLWVEPVVSNAAAGSTTRYIDFHVRACWESAASSSPQRTLGTIVRLYVPENVATGTTGGTASSLPPIVPPPPPTVNTLTMNGRESIFCNPHIDMERQDWEGYPSWPPSDSGNYDFTGSPAEAQCRWDGNSIFSCANYDSFYRPNTLNGNYNLTISFRDVDCGGVPITAPYSFQVAIFKNNVFYGNYDMSTSAGSRTLDIGYINESTVVQMRWWNNHYFNGLEDPDFTIDSLYFERRP